MKSHCSKTAKPIRLPYLNIIKFTFPARIIYLKTFHFKSLINLSLNFQREPAHPALVEPARRFPDLESARAIPASNPVTNFRLIPEQHRDQVGAVKQHPPRQRRSAATPIPSNNNQLADPPAERGPKRALLDRAVLERSLPPPLSAAAAARHRFLPNRRFRLRRHRPVCLERLSRAVLRLVEHDLPAQQTRADRLLAKPDLMNEYSPSVNGQCFFCFSLFFLFLTRVIFYYGTVEGSRFPGGCFLHIFPRS